MVPGRIHELWQPKHGQHAGTQATLCAETHGLQLVFEVLPAKLGRFAKSIDSPNARPIPAHHTIGRRQMR